MNRLSGEFKDNRSYPGVEQGREHHSREKEQHVPSACGRSELGRAKTLSADTRLRQTEGSEARGSCLSETGELGRAGAT